MSVTILRSGLPGAHRTLAKLARVVDALDAQHGRTSRAHRGAEGPLDLDGTLSALDCHCPMARDALTVFLAIAGLTLGSIALADWLGYTIFIAQVGLR